MKYLQQAGNYVRQKVMAYSAEESSPIEYFESCCICEEEFSSDSELTSHLLEHANEEEFKSSLRKFEQKNSIPERRKSANFVGQPIKRSFSQRSKSPEIVELLSDESDDESSKNKKQVAPPPVASKQVRSAVTTNISKASSNPQIPTQLNPNHKAAQIPAKSNPKAVQISAQTNPKAVQVSAHTNPKAAQIPVQTNPKAAQIPAQQNPNPAQIDDYNCTQCNQVFKDFNLYEKHLATHEKARPYACQICNKKFAYKGTLRQHLHLHIGEKSHECKICHKKFSLKRMLRQHEETHELEQQQRQGLVISKV